MIFPKPDLLPTEHLRHEIRSYTRRGFIPGETLIKMLWITDKRIMTYTRHRPVLGIGGDSESTRDLPIDLVGDVQWTYGKNVENWIFFFFGLISLFFGIFVLFAAGDFGVGLIMIIVGGLAIFISFKQRFVINLNIVSDEASERVRRGVLFTIILLISNLLLMLYHSLRGGSNIRIESYGLLTISGEDVIREDIERIPLIINQLREKSLPDNLQNDDSKPAK